VIDAGVKTSASAMLGPLALVVSHGARLSLRRVVCHDLHVEEPDHIETTPWRTMLGQGEREVSGEEIAASKSEVERRRAAAERMRGLFADVAPDRSLVDELIADRRAEAAAESGEPAVCRRCGGYDPGHD
jgi:hypothetical protein